MKRERKLVKICSAIVGIYVSFVVAYFELFPSPPEQSFLVRSIVIFGFPTFAFFFPIERVVNLLTPSLAKFFSSSVRQVAGDWRIDIEFEEGEKLRQRSGQLKARPTLYGCRISGDKLYEGTATGGVVTMESWSATDVQYWSNEKGSIISYLYTTTEGDAEKNGKTGLVVCFKAKGSGDSSYVGAFTDIDANGPIRTGTVQLSRA